MSLGDTKKELYKNDSDDRGHGSTEYNLKSLQKKENHAFGDESPWQLNDISRGTLGKEWRKLLLRIAIVLSVVVLLFFSVWTFMLVRDNIFDSSRVIISITGPSNVNSGVNVKYVVSYENNNYTTLKDARLFIEMASQFKIDTHEDFYHESDKRSIFEIGDIAPRGKGTVEFTGTFVDAESSSLYIHPHLVFTPGTMRSEMVRDKRFGIQMEKSVIDLTVSSQRITTNGDIVDYIVRYSNTSNITEDDILLLIDLPTGFVLQEVSPLATYGDFAWSLGTLNPGEHGAIRIKGTMHGKLDDVKSSVFTIGSGVNDKLNTVFEREEWVTRIVKPSLSIRQYVNSGENIVYPGEKLQYRLDYVNTSDLGMRDVVIRVKLDNDILDFSRLRFMGSTAALDAETSSVIWRVSDLPDLEILSPGDSGSVTFSIPVRKEIPVRNEYDRDIVITTIAEIDSPDVPTPIGENKQISSSKIDLKLASSVDFVTEGFYNDFILKNNGPIPPTVGKETAFTIRWVLSNGTNNLQNARVESFLPTSIKWKGTTFPENEAIQFDPRTHKIIWNIGDVKNGTGYFRAKREVRFQVSVTPTIDQLGYPVELLKKSVFFAHDMHTDDGINIENQPKTTSLLENEKIGGGSVIR